jgi:hypothetical protein
MQNHMIKYFINVVLTCSSVFCFWHASTSIGGRIFTSERIRADSRFKLCHVVSVTDPYGRILDFLDRSRYFSTK